MPRLLALSALLAVALLSAILPLIHELTDPVKVSVQVPILSHALPTNAPPAFQIEQVTSKVVAENGITGTVATLNVSPSGGTVDVLFSSGGKSMRSLSLAGSLEGSGVIQVLQKSTVGWLNIGTEEPVDRDGPGTFAVGPVVVNGQSVVLRLGVLPAVGNRQALRLRILRAHAVIAETPSALPICPASGCTGAPGLLSGPKLNIQTAASNQNLGTSTSSSDPAIISRTAWGCPDGEQSPNWVPFYERPFHIVIHHTASPPGPNGSAADVQNVWSFHTKDRAWGDIGYNYLIDPMGRVYSGRAGGPEVAGAHTKNFNFGSIGISLIGNYDVARPSPAMLRSLTKLVTELSNHYGIDPLSTSSQNGVAFSNIAGHRDLNSTSCPGTYAYRLLQAIRRQVAQQVRSGVSL
ncbi:MAG: N-acetylmuramoyl-L-alanine amidase family 2, partial [Chloroflexi bacterium]|nr:N-acetylmuramoyl-L-alanine amidase family 2 [Chloroflexota bacterium]